MEVLDPGADELRAGVDTSEGLRYGVGHESYTR